MSEPSSDRGSWDVTVLTLFPAMFPGPVGQSLAGKALETGKWCDLAIWDNQATLHYAIYDYGEVHRRVERGDRPEALLQRAPSAARFACTHRQGRAAPVYRRRISPCPGQC